MALIKIRKKLLNLETVYHEGGPPAGIPVKMGSVAVVLHNPYAGRYVEDLTPFVEDATEMAKEIVPELIAALGGSDKIQAYGKGAIVGLNGELEHGASGTSPAAGLCARTCPKPSPSSRQRKSSPARAPGSRSHSTTSRPAYVRSHFSTMDVGAIDSPRPNELLYALVMATGGRVHERLGGLRADQISVGDGQR